MPYSSYALLLLEWSFASFVSTCVVGGAWVVGGGQWAVDGGRMVDGRWMVDGGWCMAPGGGGWWVVPMVGWDVGRLGFYQHNVDRNIIVTTLSKG